MLPSPQIPWDHLLPALVSIEQGPFVGTKRSSKGAVRVEIGRERVSLWMVGHNLVLLQISWCRSLPILLDDWPSANRHLEADSYWTRLEQVVRSLLILILELLPLEHFPLPSYQNWIQEPRHLLQILLNKPSMRASQQPLRQRLFRLLHHTHALHRSRGLATPLVPQQLRLHPSPSTKS